MNILPVLFISQKRVEIARFTPKSDDDEYKRWPSRKKEMKEKIASHVEDR